MTGCPSQFGNISIQTFRATGGDWRQAMGAPNRGAVGLVYWVMRGFYAAYTDQYDSGKVWSYWVGAPTSNYFQPTSDPDLLQQNFEGGYYMLWRISQCLVVIYRNGVQQYARQGSASCDGGGGGPYPGYGSDGD